MLHLGVIIDSHITRVVFAKRRRLCRWNAFVRKASLIMSAATPSRTLTAIGADDAQYEGTQDFLMISSCAQKRHSQEGP